MCGQCSVLLLVRCGEHLFLYIFFVLLIQDRHKNLVANNRCTLKEAMGKLAEFLCLDADVVSKEMKARALCVDFVG